MATAVRSEKQRGKREQKIRDFTNNIRRRIFYPIIYPLYYKYWAKQPINEKKVVFVEVRQSVISNSMQILYEEIKKNYDYEVRTVFLCRGFITMEKYLSRNLYLIKEIADAKYIIFDEALDSWCKCKIRPETVVFQLWHACGAFKKFGMSTADKKFGNSRRVQQRFSNYNHYTTVTISSPEIKWAYAEAMQLKNSPDIIKPLGTSRTDIFFREEYKEKAFEKLRTSFKGIENKKILLYAPTFRGRVEDGKAPTELDISLLARELSDEWILLIKQHPIVKVPQKIPKDAVSFAFDVSHLMTIEDLLFVSDVCISDYSSLIFEYSLFNRPMIFFAYDLDDYFDWRGFYYPYDESFIPGPIVKTTQGIVECIKNLDSFDMGRVKAFREKFMSACDGHATERIMDAMFGEDLKNHRLQKSREIIYEEAESMGVTYTPRHLIGQWLYKGLQKEYDKLAKTPVKKNKVIILTTKNHTPSMMLGKLAGMISENKDMELVQMKEQTKKGGLSVYLEKRELVKELADARYIITEENRLWQLKAIRLRPETNIIYTQMIYSILMGSSTESVNRFSDLNSDRKLFCTSFTGNIYEKKLSLGQLESDVVMNPELKKEVQKKIQTKASGYDSDKKNILFLITTEEGINLDWEHIAERFSEKCNLLTYNKSRRYKLKIYESAGMPYIKAKGRLRFLESIALADVIVSDHDFLAVAGLMANKNIIFLGDANDTAGLALGDVGVARFFKENLCSAQELEDRIEEKLGNAAENEEENSGVNTEVERHIVDRYFANCDGNVLRRLYGYITAE